MVLEQESINVLYPVIFRNAKPKGGCDIYGYLTSKSEAEKVAGIPYGERFFSGIVAKRRVFETDDLPIYYETAELWAQDKLTVNQYRKYFDIKKLKK